MTPFIVDGSVALSWCFSDEADAYAAATLRALRATEARTPSLWPFEVANGLLMGERRGRLTPADTQRALADLAALPIHIELTTPERALREVLLLARQEGLTVYDAAYLDLALREGLPIATLNRQMREAARRLGVAEFEAS